MSPQRLNEILAAGSRAPLSDKGALPISPIHKDSENAKLASMLARLTENQTGNTAVLPLTSAQLLPMF